MPHTQTSTNQKYILTMTVKQINSKHPEINLNQVMTPPGHHLQACTAILSPASQLLGKCAIRYWVFQMVSQIHALLCKLPYWQSLRRICRQETMCNLTSTEHRFLRNGDFKAGERRNLADMSWLIQHPHPFSPTETGLLKDRTIAGASQQADKGAMPWQSYMSSNTFSGRTQPGINKICVVCVCHWIVTGVFSLKGSTNSWKSGKFLQSRTLQTTCALKSTKASIFLARHQMTFEGLCGNNVKSLL